MSTILKQTGKQVQQDLDKVEQMQPIFKLGEHFLLDKQGCLVLTPETIKLIDSITNMQPLLTQANAGSGITIENGIISVNFENANGKQF